VTRLNELKLDYDLNAEQIYNVESELLGIIDKDIMEKFKIFECLNAEKPTPLFMSLASCRSTAKKLSAINKDDGNLYNMDNNFYENLYKKPADERLNYDNCIEDFLGADIVNHPMVQNSMLTEDECNLLDRPLTIDELDKFLSKANLNSSPGGDGL
jgi:hypothetical protein